MSAPRLPWWGPLAIGLGAAVLRTLGRTWRIRWVGVHEYDAVLAGGERCIYALWHARLLPLIYSHRGRGVAVLVSRSRDGELITGVIERLGYVAARGSSHRGGREGATEMLEWAGRGRLLAVTPDGPRGPARVAKPGLVWLAARTGFPVVPVASASARSWVARSWDGFRVPKPFAEVVVAYGEPITVPRDLSPEQGEEWRLRLERALQDHTERVAAMAGERP